jgi:hypothetical protein
LQPLVRSNLAGFNPDHTIKISQANAGRCSEHNNAKPLSWASLHKREMICPLKMGSREAMGSSASRTRGLLHKGLGDRDALVFAAVKIRGAGSQPAF